MFNCHFKQSTHTKRGRTHNIITHGKEAAVNGEMLMKDGNVFGFSDFYEFSSAKGSNVKSIVSYLIEKNKKPDANKTSYENL